MAHHAYFHAGDRASGIAAARAFAREALGDGGDPDVVVREYGLLSVEDARALAAEAANAPTRGERRMIVAAADRLLVPAQNALLKTFEEPVPSTVLALVVPAEGILLPTLRSRLLPLPGVEGSSALAEEARAFLLESAGEREKRVARLLRRLGSDSEPEKQQARSDAILLLEGALAAAARAYRRAPDEGLRLLVRDLDAFMPILHEGSPPLKLMFEHLLIVLPDGLLVRAGE